MGRVWLQWDAGREEEPDVISSRDYWRLSKNIREYQNQIAIRLQ